MFRIPTEKQRLRNLLQQANTIIEVQAAQMERDRQWRLNSLPDLLGAQALAAEIERDQFAQRVAELTDELAAVTARMRAPWVVLPTPGRES